ncbi:MAG: hypothetical protein HQM12_06200, partial [SAR324 cluster bacterium]|nr:hypothetical protein [SAR324 cluster bacterium]
IGYGEANRKYPYFEIGKLATQGEIIKNSFDSYLQAGLPLKQFSGFSSLSDALLSSDPHIEHIKIWDSRKEEVFLNHQSHLSDTELKQELSTRVYYPSSIALGHETLIVEESATTYRVVQNLESKFGLAGYVVMEERKEDVSSYLREKYKTVFLFFILISLAFIGFVVVYELLPGVKKNRKSVLKWAYFSSFMLMSGIIALVIVQVYEHGALSKTQALSSSMGKRLSAIVELGIDIADIGGINKSMVDYKSNNPDISSIALTKDGISMFHTDPAKVGSQYQSPEGTISYDVALDKGTTAQEFRVAVTIPTDVVRDAILDSAKTFIVLLIACGLFSLIFLDAGTTLVFMAEKSKSSRESSNTSKSQTLSDFEIGLTLIKPAYFLIVLVNALSISFLMEFIEHLG